MTLSEFKAWFEGYTEDLDGAPSAKQWDRVKKQVKKIDGTAVTKTVFVDHYRTHIEQYPHWRYMLTGSAASSGSLSALSAVGNNTISANSAFGQSGALLNAEFDGASAMYAVGKADAIAEAA